MQKKIYIPALIAVLFGAFVFIGSTGMKDNGATPYFKYIGVKNCANTCHKSETKGKQLEMEIQHIFFFGEGKRFAN